MRGCLEQRHRRQLTRGRCPPLKQSSDADGRAWPKERKEIRESFLRHSAQVKNARNSTYNRSDCAAQRGHRGAEGPRRRATDESSTADSLHPRPLGVPRTMAPKAAFKTRSKLDSGQDASPSTAPPPPLSAKMHRRDLCPDCPRWIHPYARARPAMQSRQGGGLADIQEAHNPQPKQFRCPSLSP